MAGAAEESCEERYAAGDYFQYLLCAGEAAADASGRSGFANLRIGILCEISAQAAAGLALAASREAASNPQVSSDPVHAALDDYYSGLAALLAGSDQEAMRFLGASLTRTEPGLPADLTTRARDILDALSAWQAGKQETRIQDQGRASRTMAWKMARTGTWPTDLPGPGAAPTTSLARVLIGLASGDRPVIAGALLDPALHAPDWKEQRASLDRTWFDPALLEVAARGHFDLAASAFLEAGSSGKRALLHDAAFAALLAGDTRLLGQVLDAGAEFPLLRHYATAVPGGASSEPAIAGDPGKDDEENLARARVLGFSRKRPAESRRLYKVVIERTRSPIKQAILQEELGLLLLRSGEHAAAGEAFDSALRALPHSAVAFVGGSASRLGAAGYRSLNDTALLYERLVQTGGFASRYPPLGGLSSSAQRFIWLLTPIDGFSPRSN